MNSSSQESSDWFVSMLCSVLQMYSTHSFKMHWRFCLVFFVSSLVLSQAELKIELFLQDEFIATDLQVVSERKVALNVGSTYLIRCHDGSSPGKWNTSAGAVGTSEPNDDTTTAVYQFALDNKQVLRLQNYAASLDGEYICSGGGEPVKKLRLFAGNPSLILEPQELFFGSGQTLLAGERRQRVITNGIPKPTVLNYTWTLNGSIPLGDDPEITIELDGIHLPSEIEYEDSGNYTLIVSTSAGTISASFMVFVGVKPSVTMTSTANPSVLEQSLQLTCVDSQGIPPPEFIWTKCVGGQDVNCSPLSNNDSNIRIISLKSNTSVLTLESVGLDDGAFYNCEGRNAYGSITAFQNVQVSVPAPQSVVIETSSSSPYKAGSNLQLTCTATLPDLDLHDKISAQITWRKGEKPLNISHHRISVEDLVTSGNSRVQRLTIDPLSDNTDSGDYVCDVILSINGTDITSPVTSSAETSITVEVPSMIVEVTPSSITALDISPFNQVFLNCSLTNLDAVNLSNLLLEYSWHNGSSEFLHGHDGVSISHKTEAVSSSMSSSTLSLTASQASLFTVNCRVKIMLKEEELFRVEQGSEVTIRGPSRPDPPKQVSVLEQYNQAVVRFTIAKISYTPESYKIRYGLNPNNLEHTSVTVTGSQDVATVNEMFSITLSHLLHNQQYFYVVVAMNSEGETTSESLMFQTHALVLMQVRAGPFEGCRANQVQQEAAVSSFFKTAIVDAINSRCFCDFPSANLINSTIRCPNDGSRDLVYRAYIVRLDHLSSDQLLTYVDSWVKQEPYVTTGVAVIRFYPNCTSSVSSPVDNICTPIALPTSPEAPFGINEIYIVVGTIVGGLLLLLMLIIVILSCYIFSQKKQIRSLRRKRKATYSVVQKHVRRDSSVSGTGESASGFADMQGVDWNKGISVMDCPAYGSYTTVKPHNNSCNAVVYDHTKDDPTTCIYDSIHDITEPPANISNHRRIAMTNCAALDKEREAMEDSEEDTTAGSVV